MVTLPTAGPPSHNKGKQKTKKKKTLPTLLSHHPYNSHQSCQLFQGGQIERIALGQLEIFDRPRLVRTKSGANESDELVSRDVPAILKAESLELRYDLLGADLSERQNVEQLGANASGRR